jgi:hypothetical protein
MNYLAHGIAALEDPYQTAGVAVPDWLGHTRPRLRCRSRHAAPLVEADDLVVATVARGVCRHHAEDGWFHATPAFGELSIDFSRRIRHATSDADDMRPSFLGHILVELLLDAELMEQDPTCADRYYAALAEVDAAVVADAIGGMIDTDASPLARIIDRFREMRFLYDYLDDAQLTFRLNQVMRRVNLCELPASFAVVLPPARRLVHRHADALLTAPTGESLAAPAASRDDLVTIGSAALSSSPP